MITETQFHFLKEKLYDIGTALFFSKSDAVLKYPTYIIKIIKVDDLGQIWFYTPKPRQHVNEFENTFITEMHFYKKGKKFFLEIEGKASMVNDPEEMNCLSEIPDGLTMGSGQQSVLFKVKILKAYYFESRKRSSAGTATKIKDTIYQKVFKQRPAYRPRKLQQNTFAY